MQICVTRPQCVNTRYTWTLCSLEEQTHTFESILSRSDGDNRDNQTQAKGETFLRSYLNSGGGLYKPLQPPECLLHHMLLLSRRTLRKYSNKGEHYNTSKSYRPALFWSTFDTGLLRCNSTATGSNNHTGVSGPLLVIQARFNVSY